MNSEVLISILQTRYKSSEQCLQALEKLVAEKPWFSIARQLLAIESYRLGSDFDSHLGKAAIYSLNRSLLFDNIHKTADKENLQEFNLSSNFAGNRQDIFEYPTTDYFSEEKIEINKESTDAVDTFLTTTKKITIPIEEEESKTDDYQHDDQDFIDDFATETLAEIYAEQGYISKAISVYEKLSLRNSKKRVYFATLIDNLKKRK